MGKACVWIPSVKTKDGDVRESKLFTDLLSFTSHNRTETVDMWNYLTSPQFLNRYGFNIKKDDAGEVILEDVLKKGINRDLLEDAKITAILNRKIGAVKDGKLQFYADTTANYQHLSKTAAEFNTTSEYRGKYVAVIRQDENGIYLSTERVNEENESLAKKITKNYYLNQQIANILTPMGITTEQIYGMQDSMHAKGMVDYENAEETAEGFISLIKISEGMAGQQALPEEFAHLMIDLLQDDVLVQRLLKTVAPRIKEILGEDFEDYYADY